MSWGAIGARTTESQIHRQLGSGLSMPVGFKNRTDGNVQVAVDAVRAAAVPHAFAGIDLDGTPAILYTRGNRDCHIILRGGADAPNYRREPVAAAWPCSSPLDCPRAWSSTSRTTTAARTPRVSGRWRPTSAAQIAGGSSAIAGVMLESFLIAGAQKLDDPARLTYGQSITDECIGWDTTVEVLDSLAAAVRERRAAGAP